MAHSLSARKRVRQANKRRALNGSQRSLFRTHVKNVVKAIEAGDKEAAQKAYASAVPMIDKAAGKGLIHQNKAARHKSRLAARIQALD